MGTRAGGGGKLRIYNGAQGEGSGTNKERRKWGGSMIYADELFARRLHCDMMENFDPRTAKNVRH